MKKFLPLLALAGLLFACNNKKTEEKKKDSTTNTVSTDNATDNTDMNKEPDMSGDAIAGITIPKFKDPEVQAFAIDWTKFMVNYTQIMKDPSIYSNPEKARKLSADMKEWSGRSESVKNKIMHDTEEWQKWVMLTAQVMQRYAPAQPSTAK